MRDELRKYCVGEDAVILEGIKAIDQSDEGVALVVNRTGQLLGILTDGDIRRALLAGNGMGQPIAPHVKRSFFSVNEQATRTEVLDLMQARKIRHVPVVNESNDLLGIHFLSSIIGAKELPNWAVIMAGGKGTRLGKITTDTPKPMLKVAGKPILERLVLHLVTYGIRRIFIAVNHLSHVIEEYFGDGSQWGCTIEYLREDEPLGSGGALSLLPEPPQHPLVLMNGDLLVEVDLSQMIRFHELHDFHATMGVHYYSHEIPFGCVESENGIITGVEEKPVLTKIINGGVYVLSIHAVQCVPVNRFFPVTQIFDDALKRDLLCGAYPLDGDWIDIGLPGQLKQARGQN